MRGIIINVISFGFQASGRPPNADKVLNARIVENPGSSRQRRKHNGLNKDLAKDVLKQPKARALINEGVKSVYDVISEWQVQDQMPQKSSITNNAKTTEHELVEQSHENTFTLAVGCHAGMHRSVAIADAIHKEIASYIKDSNLKGQVHISILHSDIDKKKCERL